MRWYPAIGMMRLYMNSWIKSLDIPTSRISKFIHFFKHRWTNWEDIDYGEKPSLMLLQTRYCIVCNKRKTKGTTY